MSIANWNAGIIRPVAVAPTGPFQNGAAPGVWTLDQAAYWTKQGLWPIAGLSPNYIEDVFSTYLYTGNGSTQTITNGIDLAGKGGLVWAKQRDGTYPHVLSDSAQGFEKGLVSNSTAATDAVTNGVTYSTGSVTSTGLILGANTESNASGSTFASWTFRKQPKFFDVVTYTGNGVAGRTLAHNLGSVPGCVIIKRTSTTGNWTVWHRSLSGTYPSSRLYLQLNLTSEANGSAQTFTEAPTSTTLTFDDGSSGNGAGSTYVAYLFAHDAGGFGLSGNENVVSCGGFTADGAGKATVNLGYEPQWLMYKRTDSSASGNWFIVDVMRGFDQSGIDYLNPNLSSAETPTSAKTFPNATGFNFEGAFSATYIYVAIRRGPMAVPTLGTTVYNAIARTGTGGATDITGVGFSPDLVHTQTRDSYGANGMFDRLRGPPKQLRPASTVAEQTTTDITAYLMDGVATGGSVAYINDSGIPYINHFFRRAPSFFDEVCYTGNDTARTLTHNLAVVPELMIVKSRSATGNWSVYAAATAATNVMYLNTTNASFGASGYWNNTAPTASVFTVGNTADVNNNATTFVAYLFATCAGVSKVGSYTGTGTTQAINCGFTAGARFVLIKRTDSTGDWYYWDSARGIVAGNDPYLLMNTTTAEVTNTDYVDTSAAGFELTSTAPAAINASGGSYIFLAVA